MLVVLFLALITTLVAGMRFSDAAVTPKLALDLEGGTQLILTPRTTDGSEITSQDIDEAIEIIRQRVDASGVSEAEITSQGQSNIVVALPGQPSQETLDLVRTSAQMRFRPVLTVAQPTPVDLAADPNADPAQAEPVDPAQIEENARAAADQDGDGQLSDTPAVEPADNSDPAWMTEQVMYDLAVLDCTRPENLTGGESGESDEPLVACADDGTAKYALGPVDVEGTHIASASSGMGVNQQGMQTGQWAVNMQLDTEGAEQFSEVSQRLIAQQPPQNQFAIVLDGLVISAPTMNAVISDGRAEISGNFTRDSAATLANQLNFGSLPIDFEVQSEQQISATLGAEQLQRGLLAGLIGLGLVVLYLGFTYRGLSIVSLSSLLIAALGTYLVITLLSWTIGYRLSLPGVVGLIVAVGITADSFIVYFERIRDELREGRTMQAAIDQGWRRARRTILASDAVNLLAAVVLYFLSVGGVRGFAFTLGLTTILDVIVVFLFTHPFMQLLGRTRFFGEGRRGSGLEPASLGISASSYGTGRERLVETVTRSERRAQRQAAQSAEADAAAVSESGSTTAGTADSGSASSSPPTPTVVEARERADRPMTIAERRRAERLAAQRESEASATPADTDTTEEER